jgi:polyisoprenoid-binding protein YceI
MKKTALFYLLLTVTLSMTYGQHRYFTKTGKISFFSHTPMEDIDATNNQVTSFIDIESGEIVFAVLMKSFKFNKALMEEHFNENYVESDKYPKATFEGKILDYDKSRFEKKEPYEVIIQGKLTIHGETKEIEENAILTMEKGKLAGNAKISIDLYDYKIDIPKVVKENIAESVEITIEMVYEPYGK